MPPWSRPALPLLGLLLTVVVPRLLLFPAVNLGPDVNTPGDEITPYLAADGVTLYFSSAARGGLGFFASIGVRLTESSVKSAAASWRDRLER